MTHNERKFVGIPQGLSPYSYYNTSFKCHIGRTISLHA
jgi:hypothetical protein